VSAVAAAARLVWERADGTAVEFPLDREVMVVGRDETADIAIDEPLVSRNHARIEQRAGQHYVLDLGSTNLTRVNGQVVAERALADGDQLQFARAKCRYVANG